MPIQFTDDEAYELFLIVDSYARTKHGKDDCTLHYRERLIPFYREWHNDNPHKIHPPFQTRSLGK